MRQAGPFLCILAAGTLWGSLGLFVRVLENDYGFDSIQAAIIRLVVCALSFFAASLIRGIRKLRIKLRDFPLLACTGIFGALCTAITYSLSISYSSLAVAAILMYTAPIFVMAASFFLFHEKVTRRKITALLLATAGFVFVSGIFSSGAASVSGMGIVMGLLSGLSYGSYSIFCTYGLRKYDSFTVSAWAFFSAACGALCFVDLPGFFEKASAATQSPGGLPRFLLFVIGIGFLTSFLPFLLYTRGLSHIEASKAVIIASVEPLVAAVIGFFAFRETPTVFSIAGILLILVSVTLTAAKDEKK